MPILERALRVDCQPRKRCIEYDHFGERLAMNLTGLFVACDRVRLFLIPREGSWDGLIEGIPVIFTVDNASGKYLEAVLEGWQEFFQWPRAERR
jgi:hypothetical protein